MNSDKIGASYASWWKKFLRITKEEMAVVKNFADQAKKAKKLKVQEGAEK